MKHPPPLASVQKNKEGGKKGKRKKREREREEGRKAKRERKEVGDEQSRGNITIIILARAHMLTTRHTSMRTEGIKHSIHDPVFVLEVWCVGVGVCVWGCMYE